MAWLSRLTFASGTDHAKARTVATALPLSGKQNRTPSNPIQPNIRDLVGKKKKKKEMIGYENDNDKGDNENSVCQREQT